MQSVVLELRNTFLRTNDILIQELEHANHLNHELEELKVGIIDLVKGKLSPLLLSPYAITSVLRYIQRLINRKYPGFHLIQKYAQDVYSASNFLFEKIEAGYM